MDNKTTQELFLEAIELAKQVDQDAQQGLDLSPPDQAVVRANQACHNFTTVAESVMMATAALHAVARLVPLQIQQLKKSDPALAGRMELELSGMLNNLNAISQAYADEIEISKKINRLFAEKLLRAQHIDPADTQAVKQYVDDQQAGQGGALNLPSSN